MLDRLRPGLERYNDYSQAQAAVQDILTKEAAASASGLATIEEDDDDDGSDDDADQRSGGRRVGGVTDQQGGAGSTAGSDGDTERMDGDGVDHDYDRGESGAGMEVDDEFEREYQTLMQECQGKAGSSAQMLQGSFAPPRVATSASASGVATNEPDDAEGGGGGNIAFKLLLKRGGKDDKTREIHVPVNASLAISLMQREESEAAERSQIKKLVLEANKRDEQEWKAAPNVGGGRGHYYSRGGRGGPSGYYNRGGASGGGRGDFGARGQQSMGHPQ